MDSVRRRRIFTESNMTRHVAGGPGTTEPGPKRVMPTRDEIIAKMKRIEEMKVKGPLLRKIQQELGGLSIAQLTRLSEDIDHMKDEA